MLPAIAPSAFDRGASASIVALIGALLGIGSIVTNIPSGILATRVGERKAMLDRSSRHDPRSGPLHPRPRTRHRLACGLRPGRTAHRCRELGLQPGAPVLPDRDGAGPDARPGAVDAGRHDADRRLRRAVPRCRRDRAVGTVRAVLHRYRGDHRRRRHRPGRARSRAQRGASCRCRAGDDRGRAQALLADVPHARIRGHAAVGHPAGSAGRHPARGPTTWDCRRRRARSSTAWRAPSTR